MPEINNAVISSTMLGREDHGIFTFSIGLDFGNSGFQGYGSYALDEYHDQIARRVGTALGMQSIIAVLEIAGAPDWEHLKGHPVRAYGNNAQITLLGHYLKDDWMCINKTGIHRGKFNDLKDMVG